MEVQYYTFVSFINILVWWFSKHNGGQIICVFSTFTNLQMPLSLCARHVIIPPFLTSHTVRVRERKSEMKGRGWERGREKEMRVPASISFRRAAPEVAAAAHRDVTPASCCSSSDVKRTDRVRCTFMSQQCELVRGSVPSECVQERVLRLATLCGVCAS